MAHYILISGKSNSGKDTLSGMLKEKLEENDKYVYTVHFADHLKEIARIFYDWDGKKNKEGRDLLQKLGDTNGKIKTYDNLYYVKHLDNLIKILLEKDDCVLIPDTRYPFEIDYIKDNLRENDTVTVVRVNRVCFESPLTDKQKEHESEILLDDYKDFDYVAINLELGNLRNEANAIYETCLKHKLAEKKPKFIIDFGKNLNI